MNTCTNSILWIGMALTLTSGTLYASTTTLDSVGSVGITAVCDAHAQTSDSATISDVFTDDTGSLTLIGTFKNNKSGGSISASYTNFAKSDDAAHLIAYTDADAAVTEVDGGATAAYLVTKANVLTLTNLINRKAGDYSSTVTYTCTPGA